MGRYLSLNIPVQQTQNKSNTDPVLTLVYYIVWSAYVCNTCMQMTLIQNQVYSLGGDIQKYMK